MPKSLPVIQIDTVPFYVDLVHWEFRQVGKPDNRISFDKMKDNADHLLLLFDRSTKNAFNGPLDDFESLKNTTWVKLPSMYELDPEGLIPILLEKNPALLDNIMADPHPHLDRFKVAAEIIIKGQQGKGIQRHPKI